MTDFESAGGADRRPARAGVPLHVLSGMRRADRATVVGGA
jgi:hypothetical protein